jgi:hypothetical protein
MNRKIIFITSAIVPFLSLLLYSAILYGGDQDVFFLKKDGKIDARIESRPLNQTLRELATKFSIELKGISVGSEMVNLNLSDVPLEQLLKKMMRGYNYVLVRPERSDKLMLMVLSRADRTKYVDAPARAASVSPSIPQPVPQPVPQPATQATPVTPPQPRQTQRPSTGSPRPGAAYGTPGVQTGLPAGSSQTDPALSPMPPGHGVSGGAAAGSSGSSGPGTVSSMPGATSPGSGTGTTGSQPDPKLLQKPFWRP